MGQTPKWDTRLFSLPSITQSWGEECKLVQEEGKIAWWTDILEETRGLGIMSRLFYLWKGNRICWTLCMIFGIGRNMKSLLFMVWTWNARVSLRLKAGGLKLFFKKLFLFWLSHAEWGVLVPWPGIEHIPHAVEARSFNHWISWGVRQNAFWKDRCFCFGNCLGWI